MSNIKDISLFFDDIIHSINRILSYTQELQYEDFINDLKTQDAVLRNLEIIGEAVKSIPEDIRNDATEIPWKSIVGMRDIIVHRYFGVDLGIIWETIQSKLNPLNEAIIILKNKLSTNNSKIDE